MGLSSRHLSGSEFPTTGNSLAVHLDPYQGPGHFVGGSKAMMGGQGRFAFKSQDVSGNPTEGHGFASMGKWNRQQTVNFESMNDAPPAFPKND